jgi:hypothetical protein
MVVVGDGAVRLRRTRRTGRPSGGRRDEHLEQVVTTRPSVPPLVWSRNFSRAAAQRVFGAGVRVDEGRVDGHVPVLGPVLEQRRVDEQPVMGSSRSLRTASSSR